MPNIKLLSPEYLISSFGYAGLFFIVFAESGLLFGFFLPGDSLLITSGAIAAKELFGIKLIPLIVITISAAITGDSVGYWFGKKTGPIIFNRDSSLLFHKENLVKAQKFYEKHGGKTIVLARFMPFIRTFAPIVAGIGQMKYSTFLFYNVFGASLWVLSMTLLGFYLGKRFEKQLHWVIILVIIISVLPPAYHFVKSNKEKILNLAKRLFWPLLS